MLRLIYPRIAWNATPLCPAGNLPISQNTTPCFFPYTRVSTGMNGTHARIATAIPLTILFFPALIAMNTTVLTWMTNIRTRTITYTAALPAWIVIPGGVKIKSLK
jgi:hypothetical protein